jgi:hypothetical protein
MTWFARSFTGTIIVKNGNIYIAASVGESGPKKRDAKTITSTLFIAAKLTPAASLSSHLRPGLIMKPVT